MDSMTAKELAQQEFNGIAVAKPYYDLLGEIELGAVGLIWGENYSGKSTFALGFANALADFGRVEYIPAEEHFGITLTKKVNQLKAYSPNLHFRKYKGLESLKDWLKSVDSDVVFIDSVSVLHENDKEVVDFAQWCREHDIGMWMVNHANKDKTYKGSSMLAHEADIKIVVTKDDKSATTEKNRYLGESRTIQVPFTADKIQRTSKKPKKSSKKKSKAKKKARKNKNPDFDSSMDEIEQMMNV